MCQCKDSGEGLFLETSEGLDSQRSQRVYNEMQETKRMAVGQRH